MGSDTNGDGRIKHGARYDEQRDAVLTYTEQVQDYRQADALVGTAKTEVTPQDRQASVVRVWSGTIADLDSYFAAFAATTSIGGLPDVLTAMTVTFNKNHGDGESIHDVGTAVSAGTSGGLNVDPTASASASAAIIPDIQPAIQPTIANNVPVIIYVFYIKGDVTQAAVIAKLLSASSLTVLAWPKFRPVSHVFTLVGQQKSVSQQADSHSQNRWANDSLSYAISPFDGTRSDGFSLDTGISIRTIQLPPTIHGSITLSASSSTQTATVTVTANIPAIVGSGIAPSFDAVVNEPDPITITVTGSISPSSLSATSGQASIPTSGLYLLDVTSQPDIAGYNIVRATVFDFAYFS